MRAPMSVASTDEVDPSDRLAYWEDYNARQLVGLRCATYHDDGLQAREVNVDLGAIRVADIVGNSHVVDRSSEHVARTPKSSIFVTHLVAGRAFFVHAGGCLRLGRGDTVLYDATRPYIFGFETEMHQVMLDLPREVVADVTGAMQWPAGGHAVKVGGSRSQSLARLMRQLGETTVRGEAIDQEAVSAQLLAAAVAVVRPDHAPREAICRAARLNIEQRIGDPGLTPESVARAVGVTSRHLNRLLAVDNSSIGREIQTARLEAARRDLGDDTCVDLRIADIAARWGFSSHAHLTRAFRQQFDMTPTEFRAQQLRSGAGNSSDAAAARQTHRS